MEQAQENPQRRVMSAEQRQILSDRAKAGHAARRAKAAAAEPGSGGGAPAQPGTGSGGGGAPAVHPRAAAATAQRRRRKGMGNRARLKLSIPPHLENDPNYRYYWVADRPGRVEQLTKHDDYDFVIDAETAADGRNTGTGTRIERHADVDKFGEPIRHFLLRKPIEYHLDDEREKADHRKKLMTAIERGKTPNEQGEQIHSDGAYVPSRGIKITHGDYQP